MTTPTTQAAQAQPQAAPASLPEYTMSRYASSADLHAAMVAEIIRLRAALGAQAVPAGWACEIESCDFESNTITLKMSGSDYFVGAGQHVLQPPPVRAHRADGSQL